MKPNILLIQSDQHRRDWLGCAGADFIHSPNLDALAERGVRFSQASCNYPLCGPSRMSFLTGRHPWRNGLFTNEESLASHHLTYAHALGLAGYHTVLCGRMHFCGADQRHGFHQRIFGDFNPAYPGGLKAPEIDRTLLQACSGRRPCIDTAGDMERHYFLDYDDGVAHAAEEFLGRWSEAGEETPPLFLNVGFFLPHSPFNAPKAYVDRVRQRAETDSSWLKPIPARSDPHPWEEAYRQHLNLVGAKPEEFREARLQYAALIEYLDERIGRVLKAAEALPGETIVIYHSDHGESIGDHGFVNKGALSEGSIGVPFIAAPLRESDRRENFPAGKATDAPVSLLDLFPTLTALAGAPDIPGLDGHSLNGFFHEANFASAEKAAKERPAFSEMEIFADKTTPARTVRLGKWKYVYYHKMGPEQLFDMQTDPDELHSLAEDSDHCEILARLRVLALDGQWEPERLQEACRGVWERLPLLMKWGREIGQSAWGYGDTWPGTQLEEQTAGPWLRKNWDLPQKRQSRKASSRQDGTDGP